MRFRSPDEPADPLAFMVREIREHVDAGETCEKLAPFAHVARTGSETAMKPFLRRGMDPVRTIFERILDRRQDVGQNRMSHSTVPFLNSESATEPRMNRRFLCTGFFRFCWILQLFVWFLQSETQAQDTLRYRFAPESRVVYDVKISAVLGDIREVREGTLTLESVESTDQQTTLKASGNLNLRRQSRDGSPVMVMPDFRFGPPVGDFVNIRPAPFSIDRTGNLVDIEVQTSLPYMLGDYEQLVLDELPKSARDTAWKREREVSVIKNVRSSPFPRMIRPPGFGPPRGFGHPRGFGPPGADDEDADPRSATETVNWKVESREDGGVQVSKTYLLKTDDKVNGRPRRQMTGEGEMTFDPVKGLWKSGLMRYEIEIHEDGVSATFPVTVTFRLLTEAEAAKRAAEAEAAKSRNEAAMKQAAEAAKPKPISAEDRKELLADLRSGDERTIQKAGDRLAKAVVSSGADPEIAKALAAAAASTTGFPRASVAKALAVWATPAQEKDLIRLLSTGDFMVRGPAIQGLAKCPTKSAARVLVMELKELGSRAEASKALKTMKPEHLESEIIPLLSDKDVFTRGEAAKILQEVGTKNSLPALIKLRDSGQPFAENAAKDAIRAIELRQEAR